PVDGASQQPGSVPATFTGKAADNAGGSGLPATGSVTITLRNSDGYWNGTTFSSASPVDLATSQPTATTGNQEVTWTKNTGLPTWSSQAAGTYTVQAKTTDRAGNTFTDPAVTFTLLAPVSWGSVGSTTDTS